MDKQEKRFAFMMPQGTLVLKDDLYIKNQGKTAEEGGQVFYAINLALELAKLGHEVDIYSRNYDTKELWTETHPSLAFTLKASAA